MGVREWEKILKEGSCYGVICPACDGKRNSRECRFKRNDGRIPSLLADGLDDAARAKVEAALREAKGVEAKAPPAPPAVIGNFYVVKGHEARGPGRCIGFHPSTNSSLLYHEAWRGGHDAETHFAELKLTGHHCFYYSTKYTLTPVASVEPTTKSPTADDIAFVRKVAEPGMCWPNKSSDEVCPRCQKMGGGQGFCETGGSRQEKAKAWLAKYAPDHSAVEAVDGVVHPRPLFLNVMVASKAFDVVAKPRSSNHPETASYARVCERLYRRRFEI